MESTTLIQFGKYKGQPASVMLSDSKYCEWAMSQPGITEKYPELLEFLCHGDKSISETPIHNAMQARFMDGVFCSAFSTSISKNRNDVECFSCTRNMLARDVDQNDVLIKTSGLVLGKAISFEWYGFDVLVCSSIVCGDCFSVSSEKNVAVEIKPTMGDEYPAVLRQIKTACSVVNSRRAGSYSRVTELALVVGDFRSSVISLQQAKDYFITSGVKLVTIKDIEDNL